MGLRRVLKIIKSTYVGWLNKKTSKGKVKYFCIGRNKAGTTSLKKAFSDLRYPVGRQREAEIIAYKDYFKGDFRALRDYCHAARFFQDIPFSWPGTYQFLDKEFVGSKFILTIRDAEQWYKSITTFHAKKWGKDGKIPRAEDLRNATYISKGIPYNLIKIFGTNDEDPYNKERMIEHYNQHNQEVITYFRDRPDDLLIIDITKPGSYQQLTEFLGVQPLYEEFPWKNRT